MSSKIVLASASPRRSELLASAGYSFAIVPADIDETPYPGEDPVAHVLRLAEGKAAAAAKLAPGRFFIGADTIVLLDGEVLGKPKDNADATNMLQRLSGRMHHVITGFSLFDSESGKAVTRHVSTEVYFREVPADEIAAYVDTGCPLDKAGAYAIQGGAASMVEKINGSYTNVVGLPLCELVNLLKEYGVEAC